MDKTFEKKIGQMFIIRLQGKKITEGLVSLIKDYNIGGIALYSNNYKTYEEMLNIINELKELNSKYNDTPLFISIDQEGGRVNRLPDEFINTPSAKKLSKDEKTVEKAGDLISEALNIVGVNMNFAPVLDIQRFDDDHAIGDRCFGYDKETVTKNGVIMMNSLKKHNIIPVVKHFPGHGLVKRDSHFFLPLTFKNVKDSDDVIPFIDAINNKCDAIMVSHVMVSKMDKIYPASLSKKIVKKYLIDELKYDGLIITDDIRMKAVNLLYGYKRSAYKAIEAGNNIVLMGADYNIVIDTIKHIKKKNNDEINNNIEKSYDKIIKYKKKYKLSDKKNKMVDLTEYNKKVEELKESIS